MRSRIFGTARPGAARARVRGVARGVVALGLAASAGLLSACGAGGGGAASGGLTASPGGHLPGLPGASGSASPAMSGMDMPAPSGAGAANAMPPVTGNAVAIKNFAFAPAALTVRAGAKVTWRNEDTDAHTVTSQGSGGPLNSPALNTGGTFSFTFTTPGTYHYLCSIHPFMTATVTVTP